MPTTNPLTTLREMLGKMTATGWEQISGKYMAIDRGEHPQVFRPLTAADERGIMALANLREELLAVIEAAQRACEQSGHHPDPDEGGSCMFEYPCMYRPLHDALSTLTTAIEREVSK